MISLVGKQLTAGYGGVDIIKDIDLAVNEGEIEIILSGRLSPKALVEKATLFKNNIKKIFRIKKRHLFKIRSIN